MEASLDLYVGSSFQSSTLLELDGWECILSVPELEVAITALKAAALTG
jgi:hypothetical protein